MLFNRAFNNYLGTIAELKDPPVDQFPEIQPPPTNVINPRNLIFYLFSNSHFYSSSFDSVPSYCS